MRSHASRRAGAAAVAALVFLAEKEVKATKVRETGRKASEAGEPARRHDLSGELVRSTARTPQIKGPQTFMGLSRRQPRFESDAW